MKRREFLSMSAVLAAAGLFAGCAASNAGSTSTAASTAGSAASEQPSNGGETVKIICGYGVGGTADLIARKYAQVANGLQKKYNFIVENMTGGDGFAAATYFADDSTSVAKELLVFGYGLCYRHDLGKEFGTEEVDFDRSAMFPIGTVDDRTWIVYASPDQSLASILEKAKNGGIKMSGGNPLSDCHLSWGSLLAMEGGKVQVVPYDGGANQNMRYVAAALFIIASLTDMLDGKIARKYNLVTNFGKFMDPLADKLLVCSALICMIELRELPAWMVIIIISREFIISGFRLVASDNGVVIAASYWGKFKTTFQMIGVVLLIFNIPALSTLTTIIVWIALALTVISLVDYIVKNAGVLTEGKM